MFWRGQDCIKIFSSYQQHMFFPRLSSKPYEFCYIFRYPILRKIWVWPPWQGTICYKLLNWVDIKLQSWFKDFAFCNDESYSGLPMIKFRGKLTSNDWCLKQDKHCSFLLLIFLTFVATWPWLLPSSLLCDGEFSCLLTVLWCVLVYKRLPFLLF